jgi:hypothetical protein
MRLKNPDKSRYRERLAPDSLRVFLSFGYVLLFSVFLYASPSDRAITSVTFSPDNTFDNQLVAAGTDSGTFITVNLSGGAAAAENPDNEGGFRLEVYNASGSLVRRLESLEISANPPTLVRFNGQGDSNVNDTLAYGSYTLRAYSSMRNPTVATTIKGAGITIDRPCDLHVTTGGVLTWVNSGAVPSFCQVSMGDPNTAAPTFVRLVNYPSGIGSANTDMAWGVAMNSANQVFVSDNQNGGAAGMRVAKYNTATETWVAYNWATAATTSVADDEWPGLGIDRFDSIYIATITGILGGGNGGTREPITRMRDNGSTATEINSNEQTEDMYDIAIVPGTGDTVYVVDYTNGEIDRYTQALGASADPWITAGGGGSNLRSIWATSLGEVYVTGYTTDSFSKYRNNGTLRYSVKEARLDGATGIAVYQKAATNETFVIVASQLLNQIHIYKESAAGDTATYVRSIEDDVYNLVTSEGIAVAADSAVFVVNRGSRSVKKFTVNGVFENLAGTTNGKYISGIDQTANLTDSTGFSVPRAIAVDSQGIIYVVDHNAAAAPTAIALKRFAANGAPLGVVADIDNQGWSGVLNQPVVQMVYGAGSLWLVTNENGARVIKMSTGGVLQGHLGTYTANGGADAAEGALGGDAVGITIAPFFDRTNNRFYPEAVYFYERAGGGADKIEVWKTDLSGQLLASTGPQEVTNTNPSADNPATFIVDYAGEIYAMNDEVSAGNYLLRKWNASTPSSAAGANSMMEFAIAQGSGNGQLNTPRAAIWTDARGEFKFNPTSGRYERKFWVNDSANNRLVQYLMAWEDVEEQPVTIALAQDTSLVVSASFSGDSVQQIGGVYYVAANACTVQISFNQTMVTAPDPDTLTVQFKPSGGSFTSFGQVSYTGATWTGTTTITAGMADGQTEIKVADAYDATGTVRFIDPNPDQTDFDGGDDFKAFVIDKSAPVISVSSPASSGDSTSNATYTVSGQVTSEATGLDATIQVINWTDSAGGAQFDSVTNSAQAGDGTFSGIVDLIGPAPSNNYIEVVAVDRLGNRATLSPRRLIERVKNLGSAYVTPSSETVVNTSGMYRIIYTAAQALTGDTLRITIPASWSAPQKTAPTTNGYVAIAETGAYTDSDIAGQVITVRGLVRSIGDILTVSYGDSTASLNGRAKPAADASLLDGDNAFAVALQQAGETTFTAVSAPGGLSLTVPLRDSALGLAVVETGPGAPSSTYIAKGEETKVLTFRMYNSNIGNHTNRVTQVVVSVESETGGGLNWSNVASQVVLKNTSEGVTFATVTSMPASAGLTITPSNLIVDQGQTRDVEMYVTMSPSATADTARFYFTGVSSFTAADSTSGKTLTVVAQGLGVASRKSGNYDLIGLQPADTLSIGGDTSFAPNDVSAGQTDVAILDILLKNEPPHVDTPVNAARIDQIILTVRDAAGASLIPARVLRGIHIRDAATNQQYGGVDTPSIPNTGDTITVNLSGLTIASAATATLRVWADIVYETVSTSRFRLRLDGTSAITAKDNVSQATVTRRDDPARSEVLPFQSDSILIQRKARVGVLYIQSLRTDSTALKGGAGDSVTAGEQFFVAVACTVTSGGGAVRVLPADTDIRFWVAGADISNEFTITAPAAKTIAAGAADTLIYSAVHDLGSTAGVMQITLGDTATSDTRPRFFDAHDFSEPDKLRAYLNLPVGTDTLTSSSTPLVTAVFTIDTSYASAAETGVMILKFHIKNNQPSARILDSVVVEGISAGASVVTNVRLYHDNDNSVLGFTTDTLVATGTLNANDTTLLTLSPTVTLGSSGAIDTFFVCFDFASTLTDGDTFDARVPVGGLRVRGEQFFPAATAMNSNGNGVVEIVACRITITPDTQIVATGAGPTITLKAVDHYENIDASQNFESTVQGRNVQLDVILAYGDGDTTHAITGTSGMNNVTPTPGVNVTAINANLASGQGVVTITDTEAEVVSVSVVSVFTDSSAQIQFAGVITASATTLSQTDSAAPDSKAFLVLTFQVTNQTGVRDTITTVGIRSLSSADTEVTAVILFRDANGNSLIDSGTDVTLGTGTFSGGFATFSSLAVGLNNAETARFMVGFDVGTTVTDWNTLDARADTVTEVNGGTNLAATPLNSSPTRRIDVKATHIDLSPTSGSSGTGSNVTVTASARDAFHTNIDKDYTGGATKVTLDLTGSAQFDASSTFANEELPVGADYTQIKGNLVQGVVTLVFTDAIAETPVLSVTAAPGLSGTNDTGAYVFQQGLTVTALSLSSANVARNDTNRVVLSFRVSASGSSDSINRVAVHWLGISTADVTNLRLYRDQDANEVFSVSGDTLFGAPQTFTAETVTFNTIFAADTTYIANGTSRAFFFVVDVSGSATNGDTLDAELLVSSIRTQGAAANVPSGIRNSSGNDTVVVVAPPSTETVTVVAQAITDDTGSPGDANLLVGRFYVRNGTSNADSVQTITIKNDGTHPDTGITSVRIIIDVNKNGAYNAGTDFPFGASGTFSNGSRSVTDSRLISASGDSQWFMVLMNLSPTLTVDSRTLRIRVDTGGITMFSTTTAGTTVVRSTGEVKTYVIPAQTAAALDSVFMSGGSAIANNFDTAVVSISILDTNGVPAANRVVWLSGDTGAPITVVSSNPQTTGSNGVVNFSLRTGTPATYNYGATVDGVVSGKAAVATFLSENLSSGSNLGGNPATNTQQTVVSGAGKVFIGNVALATDSVLYVRADGTNWQLVKQTLGGAPSVLPGFSHNLAAGQETGQINFLSDVKIVNTNSALGNMDQGLVGVITRANGRRSQIYAVNLATGESTRIMPNNPGNSSNMPFTSVTWRWFDMNPNGETIITIQDGNLVSFHRASGQPWNVTNDSTRINYISLWTQGYQIPPLNTTANVKVYAAYPSWSPDGTRIAFALIHLSDNVPNGPAVVRSDIYVLKMAGLTYGGYPVLTPYPPITDTTQSALVRVVINDSFAYQPRWTRTGDGIVYSVARGPGWDWQNNFKGYPHEVGTYDTSLFVTRFVYYDKAAETAPYAPVDISTESFASSGSLDVAMSTSGQQRFAYIRKSLSGGNRVFELRTVDLSTEATITSQGGVLFDSGRVVVVVPAHESYAQGFKIASSKPDTTPTAADSVIMTGAAKSFYAPNDTTKPVYFSDSITIIMYYTASDFTDTELQGYDSDGDGIPDRTEAAVSAYFWDGTNWLDYRALRYPDENKIEFLTRHFSLYGVGLPMQARALAFSGNVQNVVAYPNPWRADGATGMISQADERYGIKLTRMPGPDVRVRVFTLAGEVVADATVNCTNKTSTSPNFRVTTAIINDGDNLGTVSWNLASNSGRHVASGVYLIILEGPGGRAVRKVAVLR